MPPIDRDVRPGAERPLRAVAEHRNGDAILLARPYAGFALENFTVHRASVSFWRALAGLSGQISAADLPALILAFSSSLLR